MNKQLENYTKGEIAFANELSKHQGRWVGYAKVGRKEEILVSGKTFTEAVDNARKKRVMRHACFMKVPRSDRVFMPNFRVL